MSTEPLAQDLDFKTTAAIPNIRGVLYSGVGSPNTIIIGANIGALYIDQAANQLWFCINAGTTANFSWIPYGCLYNSTITIDSDVQQGHLVGIFGPGAWSTSGNLNVSRYFAASAGVQNSTWISGGLNSANGNISSAEIFNGTTWSATGNLIVSRNSTSGLGALNAGIISGGLNAAASQVSSTEVFNGSIWAASGNLNISRYFHVSAGSQNAGLVTSGVNADALSATELFNGTSWTTSANLSISREQGAGGGSQSAAWVAGGTASANLTSSEIFNGATWLFAANTNISRYNIAGAGTQNAGSISGGVVVATALNATEIFNGTSWIYSANLNTSRYGASSAGATKAGVSAGGRDSSSIQLASTELHNQTIYRILNYRDYPSASNVGIAVNVTNSAITASLISGVLPSNLVSPYYQQSAVSTAIVYNNQFFGLTKFNNDTYPTLGTSLTAGNVISLSVTGANQLQLSLTTTNNSLQNNFFNGMLLSITNSGTGITSGNYPVVGGSFSSPVIRNVSATVTGGESLTITPLHGKMMSGFSSNISSTTLNGLNALNITLVNSNLSLTKKQNYIKVGDIIRIPYGVTTTDGSFYNYGSYQIQLLSNAGSVLTATAYQIRPLTLNETSVQNVVIVSQLIHSAVCLDDDAILLGLNSRMNPIGNPGWDDSAGGVV